MTLAPNTILQNRYEVVRLVAQGGMGAVYEAVDQRLGNTVALKQTLVSDLHLRDAFEREARLLARLHHARLPVVSDHFSENNGQFLVMQFIPGDDLGMLLQRNNAPFAVDRTLRWADQLLDVLDYLHSQSPPIIHRDLKPRNLKLTARDDVVLLDFGLAKGLATTTTDAATARSVFGYTPNYAPLEQIQGSGTDARSDLYALGATLYQLLTAHEPPDALTRASATVNGQPDPLRPAHEIRPDIPPLVSAMLQQALAMDPAQRFANADAMRSALRNATREAQSAASAINSSGQPTITPPPTAAHARTLPTPWSSASHPATGSCAPLALLGLIGLGALVLLAVLAWFLLQPTRREIGSTQVVAVTVESIENDGAPPDTSQFGVSRANPFPPSTIVDVLNWEIQVLEAIRGDAAWQIVHEANQFNDPAPEDMEYLLVKLRVKATFTDAEARSIGRGDFDLVGQRAVVYTGFAAVPPDPILEAELSPDNETEGWIAYLVGQEESNLLLIVDETLNSDDLPTFIALEEGSTLGVDPTLVDIQPTDIGVSADNPAPLERTAIAEDWEIAILDAMSGDAAWELIVEANSYNDPPPEGMEYIAVRVRVRSISPQDEVQMINDHYFTTLDSAGTLHETPSIVEPEPELQAFLYPGGVYEGWVVVQAPSGDDGALLVFEPSFIGESNINTRFLALR